MNFEEKLKERKDWELWKEYCGFLDLTEDYADILSLKDKSMLPDEPVIWIQTTWEGGRHTIKLAPYTRSMLETYQNNMLGCLMLN